MEAETGDANGSKETESVQETEKDKPQPLHFSVTEKVIFCIDPMIYSSCAGDKALEEIFGLLLLYMKMKKKISTKPTEFQCLLFSQSKVSMVMVNDGKDLRSALLLSRGEEETEEFDLGVIFKTLAQTLEFPHPELCKEMVPPPWVYHCVLLFGHNIYAPVMKDTNAFDFLLQNPFFACDTVYIYNNSLEGNNCETIAGALYGLYEVLNGYFFTVSCLDTDKQYGVFAQLLGHPLIRPPQNRAKYKLKELTSSENIK